jgi:hypothetical protein
MWDALRREIRAREMRERLTLRAQQKAELFELRRLQQDRTERLAAAEANNEDSWAVSIELRGGPGASRNPAPTFVPPAPANAPTVPRPQTATAFDEATAARRRAIEEEAAAADAPIGDGMVRLGGPHVRAALASGDMVTTIGGQPAVIQKAVIGQPAPPPPRFGGGGAPPDQQPDGVPVGQRIAGYIPTSDGRRIRVLENDPSYAG